MNKLIDLTFLWKPYWKYQMKRVGPFQTAANVSETFEFMDYVNLVSWTKVSNKPLKTLISF